jgi:threonylcarbamoyladenosine tRNA methylthiotransferase MtaB
MLGGRGFQEVVLTGVHLGGYGADLDPRIDLPALLELIAEQSRVSRIRLSSIDPPEVTPRLLDLVARCEPVCPHFHIPIQAGHDEVLRRMRRKYDTGLVQDLCGAIRERLPDAAIGTDVIAGFPGETEAQFDDGMRLLSALPFTYFHVFPYSRRAGTTAAKLDGHVPVAVVKQRAQRLRRLGQRKRVDFAGRFIGRHGTVLVEEKPFAAGSWLAGYTRNYQRVAFPGPSTLVNREVDVRLVGMQGDRLVGALLEDGPV